MLDGLETGMFLSFRGNYDLPFVDGEEYATSAFASKLAGGW
jgi:hypothetical protein